MLLDQLEKPLLLAPMAGCADVELAIAVAAAGGLGALPCAMLDAEGVAAQVVAFRSRIEAPINLNFFCHLPAPPDQDADRVWRARLAPHYAELDIQQTAPAGPTRRPFDAAMAEVVERLRPEVVSFHFGLPQVSLLERVRASGALVLSSATTLEEIAWLDARGVDAIIVQGIEAGGHRGQFLREDLDGQDGTLALLRRAREATQRPLIAAGGIATADDVHAAIAGGAGQVQVGTAFLLCPEARTSAVHRAALGAASPGASVITNVFSGRPARGLVNRAIRELGPMSTATPAFPHAALAMAPLRTAAESRGLADYTPLWAGINTSGCGAVPAAEIVARLCS